jgi:mono/diheme cytochrome c family protein
MVARRLRAGFGLALVAVVASACGGADKGAPYPGGADAQDPVLLAGRAGWVTNCARCHGASGNGGVGPALAGGRVVDRYPSVDAQIDVVRNGLGSMPPWKGRLTPEEIEAIVQYTRAVL